MGMNDNKVEKMLSEKRFYESDQYVTAHCAHRRHCLQ